MLSEIKRLLHERNEAVARVKGSKQQSAAAAPYAREIEKLRKAARQAFAELNGWSVAESLRDAWQLIPPEKRHTPSGEHPVTYGEGYLQGWRHRVGRISHHESDFACHEPAEPSRIIAVACQPDKERVPMTEVLAVAEKFGLVVHATPAPMASIWSPGTAYFIVFTRPGVEVRWLPEQTSVPTLLEE